jgi:hypothetical protein
MVLQPAEITRLGGDLADQINRNPLNPQAFVFFFAEHLLNA